MYYREGGVSKIIHIVHSILNTVQGITAEHYAKCSDSLISDSFSLEIKQVHFHAWIQDFFQGDPGPGRFILVLKSLYSLQRGSSGFITEKLYFRRGPTFSSGVELFPGGWGPNANFYRNTYNL